MLPFKLMELFSWNFLAGTEVTFDFIQIDNGKYLLDSFAVFINFTAETMSIEHLTQTKASLVSES